MRTSPECLPCFLRQAEHVALITGASAEMKAAMVRSAEQLLPTFDLTLSPPENAVALYATLARLSQIPDPFAVLKQESNRAALALVPRLRELIADTPDPLATAARLAIAGNIIDYGAQQEFDVERAIVACLERAPAVDHFAWFKERLAKAERILYLADNCGELVFDRLFIEQLGKPVILVVKASPIINDALAADAKFCGLTDLCRVIDNGTGCPGTPLAACSPEFQQLFRESDLIISKGQGNFETLSETAAPLFFLLLVKCQVVASHAAAIAGLQSEAVKVGDLLMLAPEGLKS
jgi:uncharacterized protein with ATP-grasp and redox domains